MLRLPHAVVTLLPRFVQPLGHIPLVRTAVSWLVINVLASTTAPRPRPLSLVADYTTWISLTDRSYSGRHLPPVDADDLPSEADVKDLYHRGHEATPSTDTSVLFAFFAQWFTDSFLRTDHTDFRRNTSNHEIDLCQIYGLAAAQTDLLREHTGGRLKSQLIGGEEFPAFLFERREPGARPVVKAEFAGLHDENFIIDTILAGAPDAHIDTFFAVGLEHGNSTIGATMLTTVFLREHNRIAGQLAQEHRDDPGWDDERLFQTTRNIMIVLLLDLVVEEYIRHIAPFDFPLENVRFIADGARWNRSNWCSIEFNLLYRWHSLVPDWIGTGSDQLPASAFRNNNPGVISRGVEALMTQCSAERAGRIGLHNTPGFLVDRIVPAQPSVEERTIVLMRHARLAPYNDYREHFGLRRLGSFAELTSDDQLAKELEAMYGDIDRLEWYVGIFAEEYPDYAMMGDLMTTMVAYDAFTQALTNPLLARNVFNERTFTSTGMSIINQTKTLQQIVDRNSRHPGTAHVSFGL
jgi:prostaglandin-endoperoxide synthase 2